MRSSIAVALLIFAAVKAQTSANTTTTDPGTSNTSNGTSAPIIATDPTPTGPDSVREFLLKASEELGNDLIQTKTIVVGNYTINVQENCDAKTTGGGDDDQIVTEIPPNPIVQECDEAQLDSQFMAENLLKFSSNKLIVSSTLTDQFNTCAIDIVVSVTTFIYRICFVDDFGKYYDTYYAQVVAGLQAQNFKIAADGTVTTADNEPGDVGEAADAQFAGSLI